MHYVFTKNEDGVRELSPIIAEAAETLPQYVKELAALAERYKSHIEIDADTGTTTIVDGVDVSDSGPIHPTMQVARECEKAYIQKKYGERITPTIKELDISEICPEFKGHLYCFMYLDGQEFQQSIIVLDKDGKYLSSFDELDETFDPVIPEFDAEITQACKRAFEAGVNLFKKELVKAGAKQIITK